MSLLQGLGARPWPVDNGTNEIVKPRSQVFGRAQPRLGTAQFGSPTDVPREWAKERNISSRPNRTSTGLSLETPPHENRHSSDRSARGRLADGARVRIGLVLSGGGLRGASHVGVLQQLIEHDVPIDIIVGSSAGAIIAAYYAAVGLTLEELMTDAERFRGRHLVAHSLNVRLRGRTSKSLTSLSGLIPHRLAQLEGAAFDRLHHNVRGIGIVCHDVAAGRPCYFATGADRGVRLSDVVRASASIPFLLPPIRVECPNDHTTMLLTDGGVSDCVPVAFAQQSPLRATHLIVSDCRWFARWQTPSSQRIVYVRPQLTSTGTLWAPRSTLARTVREGQRAVTRQMLDTIHAWRSCPAT